MEPDSRVQSLSREEFVRLEALKIAQALSSRGGVIITTDQLVCRADVINNYVRKGVVPVSNA